MNTNNPSASKFLKESVLPGSARTLTPTTVLMYHAIDQTTAMGADPHYTVTPPRFARQLQMIKAAGRRGSSVLDLLAGSGESAGSGASTTAVAITFDDGHISNRAAADNLARLGMTADFFVNPSTVGQPGFLSWAELREMQAMGMSIQSHSMVHRYLNDLSSTEVVAELTDSKTAIEQELGATVSVFAPPGGRMPAGFAQIAGAAGYSAVCSSAVGFWPVSASGSAAQAQKKAQASKSTDSTVSTDAIMIPRFAMLAGTNPKRFTRWVTGSRRELWISQSRGKLLNAAKQAVGNQRYERLRQALLGGPPA